jgi:TRAP-type C4-dicarboxylate transport system substrate-binding protein
MSSLTRRRLLAAGGAALATAALGFPTPAEAASITLKLGSLAPEGSTWHKGLQKMAASFTEISGGAVEMKIYAGGVAGNETVILRKMRINQLQVGALTNLGLLDIDPAAQVATVPGLIRSYGELDYVMEKMTSEFERRIAEKGFVVLGWSEAGWSRLFTKEPITNPDDIGKVKMFAWEGDPKAVEAYKVAGFNPVVVSATDVLPSLQSGLLTGFPGTPLSALAMQWFGLANNMLDFPWAPLLAAVVVNKSAWDVIPEAQRSAMLASARTISAEMKAEVRKQDTKAIEVMKKYGLKVNSVDDATRARWNAKAVSMYPVIRGGIVPTDIFDRAKALAEEYRKTHP